MNDKINIRGTEWPALELLRMVSIKGQIIGGSGNTIYNLYTQFGLTQANYQKNLALSVDTTDVHCVKCNANSD